MSRPLACFLALAALVAGCSGSEGSADGGAASGTSGTGGSGGSGSTGGGQGDAGPVNVTVNPANCGNGRLDPGEACDDGANTGACGTCDASCHIVALCSCTDPTPDARTYCVDGKLYEYDSCLQRQELAQDCGPSGCMGNACLYYGPQIITQGAIPGVSAIAVVNDVVYTVTSYAFGSSSRAALETSDAFFGARVDLGADQVAVGDLIAMPGMAVDAAGDIFLAGVADTEAPVVGPVALEVATDGGILWTTPLSWNDGGSPDDALARPVAAALDGQGNLYVAGRGPGFVVSKLDISGRVLWTQAIAGTVDATALAVDDSGVYVAGDETDAAGGLNFARVAKYGPDGTLAWSERLGPQSTQVHGMAADGSGNVYLAGETGGAFDGFMNVGGPDIVLVKIDAAGSDVWHRQIGTPGEDVGMAVVVAPSGDVVITGTAGGSLDAATQSETGLFIRSYDASGQKEWDFQGLGGAVGGQAVTTDSYGNIFVGSFTPYDMGNQAAYGASAYMLKLDPNGDMLVPFPE